MKIAIVGCGGIAKVHAECIHQLENLDMIAYADIKTERARNFADQYGGKVYNTLEEMLEKEKIDALHICTPHYLHVPMAVYALERGIHVFMEKPPVISASQFNELQAVKSDKRLGICFQNRYNPSIIQVKKMISSGETGKINGVRGIVNWSRSKEYYTESGWRGNLATEGGGVLINQSIHTLDLLAYLLGTPVSVDATMTNHHLKGVIEVEDMMEAYIRFEGDKIACFYATTAYCADVPPLIELSCENMTIRIEDLDVTCYYKDGESKKLQIEHKTKLGKSYWGAGHMDCITDYYDSIEKNRPFSLDLNHLNDTILLLLRTYESARTGKEISIR
ncbi:Gfo/Idh/MocA family protein [Anaerocolumna sp. MB42-C2]|uniref:Gfo/Idh/MocA family protein n=1 Tax=Anaerocolumna sp. MB42-C2 TaxID=3070997 RepID=UPI0027E20773|nr:Gfo/Idh/MocA family oxidoreductase [Anaerocolumna sp. MB42-C2]WMJ87512.1 Gfo/Idh/MocA family oxidoreductase [Anaerocolumna sp. MB42-C2]